MKLSNNQHVHSKLQSWRARLEADNGESGPQWQPSDCPVDEPEGNYCPAQLRPDFPKSYRKAGSVSFQSMWQWQGTKHLEKRAFGHQSVPSTDVMSSLALSFLVRRIWTSHITGLLCLLRSIFCLLFSFIHQLLSPTSARSWHRGYKSKEVITLRCLWFLGPTEYVGVRTWNCGTEKRDPDCYRVCLCALLLQEKRRVKKMRGQKGQVRGARGWSWRAFPGWILKLLAKKFGLTWVSFS